MTSLHINQNYIRVVFQNFPNAHCWALLIRIWHGKCIDLWIAKERRIECKRAPPSPKTDMSRTSMRCDSYTHPSSGGPISSYITSWTQLSSLPNDSWWPCSPMPPWQHISWRGIFVQRRYVATPPNLYPTPCLCRNTHAVPPGSHVTPDIIEREAPCWWHQWGNAHPSDIWGRNF